MSTISDKLILLNETKLELQNGLVERGSISSADSSVFRDYATTGIQEISPLYVRDPSMLILPEPSLGQNRVSGLVKVFDTSLNIVTNTVIMNLGYSGNYTMDWGDGSIVSDITDEAISGSSGGMNYLTLTHTYNYDSSITVLSDGVLKYKQAIFDFIGHDASLEYVGFSPQWVAPQPYAVYSPPCNIIDLNIIGSEITEIILQTYWSTLPLVEFGFTGPNKITSFSTMFRDMTKLRKIRELYTNESTNFDRMFLGCFTLTTLPLSLDISKAVEISSMFSECRLLKSLPVLDYSNVNNMSFFASNCYSLNSINYDINSYNCTNHRQLFQGCIGLTYIKSIDSSISENGKNAFSDCISLRNMPFTSLRNMTDTEDMFRGASSITNLEIDNIESTTRTNYMFAGMHSLESIHAENVNPVYYTAARSFLDDTPKLVSLNGWNFSDNSEFIFTNSPLLSQININFDNVGPIDLSGTSIDRQEIVKIFNALPSNTTINISNTLGNNLLTPEDLAIATDKGCIVIR